MPQNTFLRRRNALWRALRTLPPDSPEFEGRLEELARLIRWDRGRLLAGLGLAQEGPEGAGPVAGQAP